MTLIRPIFLRLYILGAVFGSWRRKLWARAGFAKISFGHNVRVDRNVILRTSDGGSITIGANTHIWPGAILDARGGQIVIGENGLVNAGCYIVSTEKILVGRDALIAEHVTIRDQDHGFADGAKPYSEQGRIEGPVIIGDNVWIGAKSTVTRNVDIASGTIIGANSVVTKSLSGAQIFAGAPARPLREKPDRP